MERDRSRRARNDDDRRRSEAQPVLQPDLHHGRLRRPRFGAADPPAGRHARPDGQAVGRDHRDADHRELPRRSVGAPVLHLDARRPQGSGRHGAQDRELRLPDAPPRRRGAGRDHHRVRLRHARRHRTSAPLVEGGEIIEPLGERILGRVALEDILDPFTSEVLVKPNEEIDEDQGQADRRTRASTACDPLGAHLPGQARHLRRCATAAIWPAAAWSTSARRSASSPPSPSASRARS